jgi:hypothetical protein
MTYIHLPSEDGTGDFYINFGRKACGTRNIENINQYQDLIQETYRLKKLQKNAMPTTVSAKALSALHMHARESADALSVVWITWIFCLVNRRR